MAFLFLLTFIVLSTGMFKRNFAPFELPKLPEETFDEPEEMSFPLPNSNIPNNNEILTNNNTIVNNSTERLSIEFERPPIESIRNSFSNSISGSIESSGSTCSITSSLLLLDELMMNNKATNTTVVKKRAKRSPRAMEDENYIFELKVKLENYTFPSSAAQNNSKSNNSNNSVLESKNNLTMEEHWSCEYSTSSVISGTNKFKKI
ncbi:hypothetical protein ABK040_003732 [Willaertia magna]